MAGVAFLWLVVMGLLPGFPGHTTSRVTSKVEGSWHGLLRVGTAQLRIVFHLREESEERLGGSMDSPDQGATGISLSSVRQEGDSLWMEVRVVGGVYAGTVLPGDTVVVGSWSQGGLRLPLQLHKGGAPEQGGRAQDPLPPFPYQSQDVFFASQQPGITLAGTLTLPPVRTPVPGIVLISGSGPQDRDETVFGHRPFLVLADYLTKRGFAVLRFDDRGVGRSTGANSAATLEMLALDVRGAITLLKSTPEVDSARVGLLGHSEGGLLASMVASDSGTIAFLVLMASPGVPLDELLLMQSKALARASGADEAAIDRAHALNRSVYSLVRTARDSARVAAGADSALRSWASSLSEQERGGLGDLETFLARQLSILTSPWFRSLLTHDPRTALRRIRCPVLAIIGAKDLQVPPEENLDGIRRALTEAGNERIEVRMLPGLNHLFQTATTGLPAEYGSLEETIAPSALSTIGEWLTVHTRPLPVTPQVDDSSVQP